MEDGLSRPFELTEHTDYRWANIDEIPFLDFVDSDLQLYPDIKKWSETLKK